MIFPSPTGSKRLRLFPGGRPLPRSRWTSAWTPQLVPVVRLLAAGGGGGAQVGWRCGALDDGWGMFRGDIFMVIRYDIVYIYIYIILIYIYIVIYIYTYIDMMIKLYDHLFLLLLLLLSSLSSLLLLLLFLLLLLLYIYIYIWWLNYDIIDIPILMMF